MEILYEDNHIIAVNKTCHDLVQGDRSGDTCLCDELKSYLKVRDCKPGNVFIGVVHRLDRPVSGVVLFAKTSKSLSRLNELFRTGAISKTYWAITKEAPPCEFGELRHWLMRNERENRSYASPTPCVGGKESLLRYRVLSHSDRYHLLEIALLTGRHHQIRCQLAAIGCPVRGDLKYGYARSNVDGGISLHARSLSFVHPVSGVRLELIAPVPCDVLWSALTSDVRC